MSSALGESAAGGWHASGEALVGYVAGSADAVTAWSVEAHLISCGHCRDLVSHYSDAERLARNRAVLVVRAALPDGGWARRIAARCGVPDYVLRLLAATPSLRGSWLLSILGVLAVVTGATVVAGGAQAHRGVNSFAAQHLLVPFLLLSPLVILANVAAAFLPLFEPGYRLAVAAPFSGLRLLLLRSVSALGVALVPAMCAGFIVPGPAWLPAALLVPSLALCAVALAAATIGPPVIATLGVAASWVVSVLAVTQTHAPLVLLGRQAQSLCAVVLLVAAIVVFLRRERFDLGWLP